MLDALKAEPGLDITVLAVNYDTEKDLKKQFAIRSQSTLPLVLVLVLVLGGAVRCRGTVSRRWPWAWA